MDKCASSSVVRTDKRRARDPTILGRPLSPFHRPCLASHRSRALQCQQSNAQMGEPGPLTDKLGSIYSSSLSTDTEGSLRRSRLSLARVETGMVTKSLEQ